LSEQPDKNMRRLKRVQTDAGLSYTLETAADQKRDNLLCNYCAWKATTPDHPRCESYSNLTELQESHKVGVMVRTCSKYQPILTFTPKLVGFDGYFNTFRIGLAWFGRLMPGVTVGLMNSHTEEIFAKAAVVKVVSGPFSEMSEQHAHMNHMLLGLEPDEASEKMRNIMRQAYGKFVRDDIMTRDATVIYLRNLKEQA
jgi:hypothetical protein